ncbi:hypothetical protein CSB09_00545 [Candidatus Gracilibacteria bacterium]|nr:MAG: hypothetical protein CSB09_00545 [Candidatus Gracilibacteria bacterium]
MKWRLNGLRRSGIKFLDDRDCGNQEILKQVQDDKGGGKHKNQIPLLASLDFPLLQRGLTKIPRLASLAFLLQKGGLKKISALQILISNF